MAIFQEWLDEFEYEVLNGDPKKIEVSEVVFDSRLAKKGTVFVAMRGANVDSHAFLPQVIQQRCEAIVVEEDNTELPIDVHEIYDGITVILVSSAREALAKLSAARFNYPAQEMTMIGITGTKGKTTTAHMIRTILAEAGQKVGIIGTTGIFYGDQSEEAKNTTPESYELHRVFRKMADAGMDSVVMECSSQGFKLHRTDGILFDIGILTNIEPDHIGPNEHKDFEEYKSCKSRIFQQSRQGVLNLDADYAEEFLQGAACPMYTFSMREKADMEAEDVAHIREADYVGLSFTVKTREERYLVKLNLPGRYNVANALAAMSAATLLKLPREKILSALTRIKVDGRMEIVFKNEEMTVLVDYAHNAMAMENLLSTLQEYKPQRLVVVFGCGGNRARERRFGMGETAARMADLSVLTADNSRFERTEDILEDIKSALVPAGGKYIEIPDRKEAIRYAMEHHEKGDMIAVIGKGHEDYNEVNGVRTHFLDREAVEECAKELGLVSHG